MTRLERVRRAYETALEWLVIALMAVLFVEVTLGIAYRTFGASLVWYDEVASILLAWLTFYGSALASVKRAHIGCPEVMALLPAGARVAFRVLAELLTIAFFLTMGWTGYQVLGVLSTDSLVSLPAISVAWAQSVIPVSAALIVAAEILTLPQALAASRRAAGTKGAQAEAAGGASQ